MRSASASVYEGWSTPAAQAKPVVFIVDDDLSMRESLESLVSSAGWESQTFGSAGEFLARRQTPRPSCLVLDVSLPDLDGLELQRRMAADRIDMPIIFVTGYGDVPTTVKAMKAGAVEFLTKPFHPEALLGAVQHSIERSCAALQQEREARTLRENYASLTPRERDVMSLVVRGLLNKQIAVELGITETTVKAHRGHLMGKMEAQSLPDLVKMAARLALEPDAKA